VFPLNETLHKGSLHYIPAWMLFRTHPVQKTLVVGLSLLFNHSRSNLCFQCSDSGCWKLHAVFCQKLHYFGTCWSKICGFGSANPHFHLYG